jgi:hypothetical protein
VTLPGSALKGFFLQKALNGFKGFQRVSKYFWLVSIDTGIKQG